MANLQQYRMLIDGQWLEARSRDVIECVDPAEEEPFAVFPSAAAEEVDAAVSAARHALPAWSAMPVDERASLLRKVAAGIRARCAHLAPLETRDMGKPIYDSTTFDVPDAAAA